MRLDPSYASQLVSDQLAASHVVYVVCPCCSDV